MYHGVRQYIIGMLDSLKHLGFSFEEARRTLGDIVVTYIGYIVFRTELLTFKCISKSNFESTRHRTINTSNKTAVVEARSSRYPKMEHAFKFHTYAKTYWQDYLLYVSGHESAIFKLSSELIGDR